MSKDSRHIEEEHLMAYLLGEADAQLVREIEHWLALSEENKAFLNELEAAWVESGKLKIKPVVVDVDSAWSKLSAKMDAEEKPDSYEKPKADEKPVVELRPERKGVSRFTQTFLRIAAVVVLAVGLWAIRTAILKPQLQIFASEDSIQEIDLVDGSTVSMNENTRITVPEKFTENTRELKLKGEAFFKIEPDKEKPFIIRAEDAYIKVLGTSFNVKTQEASKDVEVYVEEGVVMLYTIDSETKDTASVLLNVGETGMYDGESKEVIKLGETDAEVLYWLNKTLIFKETDLGRVFEILEISFDVSIGLEDETVENCMLNATFKNEKIDYILEVITLTFGLELEKTDEQTYFIKGEGCE